MTEHDQLIDSLTWILKERRRLARANRLGDVAPGILAKQIVEELERRLWQFTKLPPKPAPRTPPISRPDNQNET